MKLGIKSAIIALALFSATAAQAANAIVTTNLNLRTGPGTNYRTLGSIPNGARVDVNGCTRGYGWCRVNYAGRSGWASSRYLAVREGSSGNYSNNNFGNTAAAIGIPLIAGVVIGSAINNDRYDRWDRPYYRPHRPYYRPHYRPNYRPGWDGYRPGRPGWENGHRPGRPHWNRPRRGGDGPHGQ
ncbi:SH3 domain-containing protein [Pseudochrobactrum sp. XF203]|uniref:SH3 domain-containing protein n=1 Tax=Pseudochrobactrum sp. XF203 TaxID=2879116 RepID=UPI001CE27AAF|nr:SH3 domain-containing protein [Pseudochrobactrum sp. XF203]UCA44795.1 SH3 domain-containing protein [Pseudochrobactrum sp. XF203]